MDVIRDKPKTAYQTATEIPWLADSGGATWQSLSPLNKRLAVGETLSHLESLRGKGEVHKTHQENVCFYRYSK